MKKKKKTATNCYYIITNKLTFIGLWRLVF